MRALQRTWAYLRAFGRAKRHRTDLARHLVRRPLVGGATLGMDGSAMLLSNRLDPNFEGLPGLRGRDRHRQLRVLPRYRVGAGGRLRGHRGGQLRVSYRHSDAYDEVEKLVIAFAEAMTSTPAIADDLAEVRRQAGGPPERDADRRAGDGRRLGEPAGTAQPVAGGSPHRDVRRRGLRSARTDFVGGEGDPTRRRGVDQHLGTPAHTTSPATSARIGDPRCGRRSEPTSRAMSIRCLPRAGRRVSDAACPLRRATSRSTGSHRRRRDRGPSGRPRPGAHPPCP